ncbi:MAG: NAD(P)/FAD-dependent oxidoreductase [Halobacteria archaeon]|nr:NAD(P)/FAD-dependent oxidoreductase [Halobacteria archaeon]
MSNYDYDVTIIGAGPAGLSAGIFTARAELDTLVIEDGKSILRRNAHLENFLGFPAGVNSRLLLDMGLDQFETNGGDYERGKVENVEKGGDADDAGFVVHTEGTSIETQYVVVASWADTDYLDGLGVEAETRGSKTFLQPDEKGRTKVEGIYAAGRIAGEYHQTIVNAGHGATVGLTVIHDSDVNFYHDWVVPEGYFTGRGRDVPPGCEEIDEEERLAREDESLEVMQDYFAEPHPEEPVPHPSQADEDDE